MKPGMYIAMCAAALIVTFSLLFVSIWLDRRAERETIALCAREVLKQEPAKWWRDAVIQAKADAEKEKQC